jgi:hypothetical protein
LNDKQAMARRLLMLVSVFDGVGSWGLMKRSIGDGIEAATVDSEELFGGSHGPRQEEI